MKRLPDAEFDVMACIWQCDAPVTSGEIMRRMGSERGWKTPALITLLHRLIERGFLRSEKPGRERLYYPLVARDEYLQYETEHFLSRVHGGSLRSLMSALGGGNELTRADCEELISWARAKEAECPNERQH